MTDPEPARRQRSGAGAYLPQLDGLRAIAVVMVVTSHWSGGALATWWWRGNVGVQLFFTLSGYLITGILLDSRRRAEGFRVRRRSILPAFYARRFLRIFPVYYATLAAACLLGFSSARDGFWWHLAYLSNVRIALLDAWGGRTAHFWSLSVEEQFYLVWPWLILFVSVRRLRTLILMVSLTGPMTRLAAGYLIDPVTLRVGVLPFASLDTLGLGALLALIRREPVGTIFPSKILWTIAAMGTALHVLANLLASAGLTSFLVWAVSSATRAFPLVCLVAAASRGLPGILGRVLELRPLVYIGRISYGIYLFHNFVPPLVRSAASRAGIVLPESSLGLGAASAVVLLLGAAASWRYFEHPINRIKARFPYVTRQAQARRAGGTDGDEVPLSTPPPAI